MGYKMKFPIITFIGVLAFVTYVADKAINKLDEPKPIVATIADYEVVQYFPLEALDYDK